MPKPFKNQGFLHFWLRTSPRDSGHRIFLFFCFLVFVVFFVFVIVSGSILGVGIPQIIHFHLEGRRFLCFPHFSLEYGLGVVWVTSWAISRVLLGPHTIPRTINRNNITNWKIVNAEVKPQAPSLNHFYVYLAS